MKINEKMIKNILTLRYDPTLETKKKKLSIEDFQPYETSNYLESIEKTIIQTIKNKLGNEENVSVALSGGIDSVLVTSLLRKALPKIKIEAISIKFADSTDETKIAAKIAHKLNANHHVVPIENFLEELPKAISIVKMPFWDTHWFHVVKTAKKFSKSLVSGDGGDELFGGYTFRYEKFLSNISPKMDYLEKTKLYLECHQRDWVNDQEKLFDKKAKFSWDEIYSQILPYFKNSSSPIDQVFLADINGKLLYNWMPLNQSFHSYFKINAVTPLLSDNLIKIATHLPNKQKYNHSKNIGKIPLREILSKQIEPGLMSSKKQGFSVNTINLWKSHGKELCKYYLDNARIIEDGWINQEWVENNFKKLDIDIDVRYVNKFLGLLAFEIWYRLFVTKEMNENTTLKI
jgi:asparagine synthase (glutamine-hydrolysing)